MVILYLRDVLVKILNHIAVVIIEKRRAGSIVLLKALRISSSVLYMFQTVGELRIVYIRKFINLDIGT
ncbi:hypothetical protein D9M72_393160 [compost metagenome]